MGKIIAITNQKGGVGKTTTAVNLAACLNYHGKKVLLCDFDPQGNATSSLGVTLGKHDLTSYEALIGTQRTELTIKHTRHGDIMPCGMDLAGAEPELANMQNREYKLREALEQIRDKYDYILIDCPPTLGLLTINAAAAADSVLIPIQCEFLALEGVAQLIKVFKAVKANMNPKLEIEGVVLTMYDSRTNLSSQVAEEVKRYFGAKVYHTMIPRTVRLAEAPSFGKPVIEYDKYSRGAECYLSLAEELLSRNEK